MGIGPAGSVFEDNSFYRETWGTRREVRHVSKRYVKLQVRDLVRVVGIVAPFATRGVAILGKFVLSSTSG